ncbi:MAG TPA: hypothetical protein VGX16_03240, partial [Solirubrobacteraceae bacterium]|nr:hypothetical protein [Solirubrobacteraceae bacterium]
MAVTPQSPGAPAQEEAPARREGPGLAGALRGTVRLGRRTKLLVGRLARGDIAVIDHLNIDRVSAEELIAAGVVAVLNCRDSSSGAYPNLGPQLLVEAGVRLVDLRDDSLFKTISDGDRITVRGGEVLR